MVTVQLYSLRQPYGWSEFRWISFGKNVFHFLFGGSLIAFPPTDSLTLVDTEIIILSIESQIYKLTNIKAEKSDETAKWTQLSCWGLSSL